MKKRFVAFILTALTIISVSIPTTAHAEDVTPRASAYFAATGIYPVALGNGMIKFEIDMAATHSMEDLGASVVHIYEEQTDGTFLEVETYRKETSYWLLEHNTAFAYVNAYYIGIPGRQYYAIVGFYAKDASGNETLYFTSKLVTAT